MGWCQWLLQVWFTFIVEKIHEVKVVSFISCEVERVTFFSKKCILIASNVVFGVVGMSRVPIVVDPMMPSIWMSICTNYQILVQLGVKKVRLLNKPNKKMVSNSLLETYSSFKCILLHVVFSKFNQQYMIECQRAQFDVRHHMYPCAFSQKPSNGTF